MGTEIERKFLVKDDSWRTPDLIGTPIRQGYLAVGPPVAVRVRIAGDKAILNIKSAVIDVTRLEFEYPVPLDDAQQILESVCDGRIVRKTRFLVDHAGMTWEIDVFEDANQGLVVAELELDAEDQPFEKPPWLGDEVSGDPRYLNTHLSRHPYTQW